MYQNVNFSQFCDSFSDTYKGNFSYNGKQALFDYLEEYEDSTGETVELDTIALCCEYAEYSDLKEAMQEHCTPSDWNEDEYSDDKAREYFNDNTQLIEFEGGIIIQNF